MSVSRRRFAISSAAWAGVSFLPERADAILPRPKLVILLIAEQFRSDYLERYGNLMGAGGFRKLIADGAYFPDCRLGSSSFSASGLTTLATGTYPDTHGIVADAWYDPIKQERTLAGPGHVLATTLAEQVRAADPGNLVIATGLDLARTALVLGGSEGRAIALEAPAARDPQWLAEFRKTYSPDRFKDAKWQALRADPKSPPLRVLTDDPSRPGEFQALYRSSPFAQQAQFELLRVLITGEKAGLGENFAFVPVILSSMALLGYEVGADSPLMREMALQLDQQVEITLEALNKTPGAGNYALVFTAAHGAPPEPTVARRFALALSGDRIARVIDGALSEAYDASSVKNRYVDRYLYPFLYLRQAQLRRYGIPLRQARRAAGEAALRIQGVSAYYTADGDCSVAGEWRNRMARSFHALRSGDVMLAYQPNAVEESGAGRGVSYGSLYNYDTRVPLIFYGRQFRPRTIEEPAGVVDIAPTLARAMNVAPPSSAIGRVLGGAFAAEPRDAK